MPEVWDWLLVEVAGSRLRMPASSLAATGPLAQRPPAQGCLPAHPDGAEAGRLPGLLRRLAPVVACRGDGGDRRGSAGAAGGRQDLAAQSRSRQGLGALHSVSVWASEYGLSLGQVACDEKSNEITAIPELLRLVDIEGAIITIDAMGTQKAIAAQILAGKADYVLALKGNQEAFL